MSKRHILVVDDGVNIDNPAVVTADIVDDPVDAVVLADL